MIHMVSDSNPTTELKSSLSDIINNLNSLSASKMQDSKLAEKHNHILAQLDALNAKINSLENTVSVGVPLAEATDTINKLDNVQHGIETLDNNLQTFMAKMNELKQKEEDLRSIYAGKISKSQFETLYNKVDQLEKLYDQASLSETKQTLVSFINILEKLDERVKALEAAVVKDNFVQQGGAAQGSSSVESKQVSKVVVEKKQGFLSGFFSGLNDLFKKK